MLINFQTIEENNIVPENLLSFFNIYPSNEKYELLPLITASFEKIEGDYQLHQAIFQPEIDFLNSTSSSELYTDELKYNRFFKIRNLLYDSTKNFHYFPSIKLLINLKELLEVYPSDYFKLLIMSQLVKGFALTNKTVPKQILDSIRVKFRNTNNYKEYPWSEVDPFFFISRAPSLLGSFIESFILAVYPNFALLDEYLNQITELINIGNYRSMFNIKMPRRNIIDPLFVFNGEFTAREVSLGICKALIFITENHFISEGEFLG